MQTEQLLLTVQALKLVSNALLERLVELMKVENPAVSDYLLRSDMRCWKKYSQKL